MPCLDLALLGPVDARLDATPLSGLESDKVRALLFYLCVESERPHRRSALAALLWPERPDRAALLNLNQALANLRRSLGDRASDLPFILTNRETLQRNPAARVRLDLAAFHALLDACEAHNHRDAATCTLCAEQRDQALMLYRGEFLEQFALRDSVPFQEWALIQRERAHQRALAALEDQAMWYVRRDEHELAIAATQRILELDPWREEAHRQLMRLYWRHGSRSAALAQYERCRDVLERELGVEPDEETMALYEQIRSAAAPEQPAAPAAEHAERVYLPHPATPFLGRHAELALLSAYLADPACRLVTIVGLGGSGKTRLAIQAASLQRHAFSGGVWFVPLASLADAAQLVPILAQRLGIQLDSSQTQPADAARQLGASLRGQHLLVLDNLEQIDDAGPVIAALLDAAPETTLLATSRRPLGLQAEWTLDIAGLELPDTITAATLRESAATALFMQAAQRASARWQPTHDEQHALARICRRLGGHPLAIELAAAWVRTLRCDEIEAELQQNFDLLASTASDLPERHRTLRAVFDATWRLLPETEQAMLEALSLCRGGFDRACAAEVAGAAMLALASLVNKSLVARANQDRYDMHEFVRQGAYERLVAGKGAAAVTERFSRYFFGLLERAEPFFKGPEEPAWLKRLDAEHDNLRAALGYALDAGQAEAASRAAEILRWYWYIRGHIGEGHHWMERVLAELPSGGATIPAARLGKIQHGAGIFADETGRYALARQRYTAALEAYRRAGDTRGLQATTNSLGILEWAQGRYPEAQQCFEHSLALCRELGHTYGIANSLNSLGTALHSQGDPQQARRYFEEALDVARHVGYEYLITLTLDNIGDAARALGDLDGSEAAYTESLALQRAVGDVRGAALSHQGLGMVALARGLLERAGEHIVEGLRLSWQTANRRELTTYVDNLAALLAAQSDYAATARLCAATQAYRARLGAPLAGLERVTFEHNLAVASAHLSVSEFQNAWVAGSRQPLEEQIAALLDARPPIAR